MAAAADGNYGDADAGRCHYYCYYTSGLTNADLPLKNDPYPPSLQDIAVAVVVVVTDDDDGGDSVAVGDDTRPHLVPGTASHGSLLHPYSLIARCGFP